MDLIENIQKTKLQIAPAIDLQEYLKLEEKVWKKDLSYILKVNNYIQEQGFPCEDASDQERSFHIIGDEKWIIERLGKSFWRELMYLINLKYQI